jgi:hypothetical protein
MKLTEVNNNAPQKAPQFKGVARSIKELLASIKNGQFTLDGRKLVVRGSLSLKNLGLTSLLGCPKYVGGEFDCSGNKLKTLEGAPQEVDSFNCSYNDLFSLEGGPQKVEWKFNCSNNKLKNLFGAPKIVGNDFICDNNKLETLEGAPQEIGSSFSCENNYLKTLEDGPTSVGSNYICDNNELISLKGAPRIIKGTFSCDNNKLTSLEGCPRYISGSFYCKKNKLLTSLKGGPRFVGEDVYFNSCTNLISLQDIHLHFPKVRGTFYLNRTGPKTSVLGFLLIQQLKGVVLDDLTVAAILNEYIETRNRNIFNCALELINAGYEAEAKL